MLILKIIFFLINWSNSYSTVIKIIIEIVEIICENEKFQIKLFNNK